MQWHNEVLLAGALLLGAAITLGGLSSRLGVPFLLVFLLAGMAAGEDGPGGIAFDDVPLSFLVGNLALAVILLDGGLRTRLQTFRVGLRPALLLASVGVAITAAATGAFAAWMLDIDWRLGLLLGAIVASTDAAAVFSLLKSSGLRLNDRIGATLEIESGVNDPMAIFLTMMLIAVVQTAAVPAGTELAAEFLRQFGLGTLAGIGAGMVLAATARWWSVGEGLAAILIAAAGVGVFALTNLIGGSGFLAVYLFGLVAGHRWPGGHGEMLRAMDGLAWLSQSVLFLLLGLLVTPSELPQLLGASLAISVFLILVARPAAVVLCLAPFRFSAAETAYVAWVGLRGAVPIVLALFPLLAGVPQARLLFNVAFVVVLVSLLVQGTTVAFAARRLRIELPQRDGPLAEHALAGGAVLAEFRVADAAPACGTPPRSLVLPAGCRIVRVHGGADRTGAPVGAGVRTAAPPEGAEAGAPEGVPADAVELPVRPLARDDVVALIGTPQALERCHVLFASALPAAAGREGARPGGRLSWQLPAHADWHAVCELYGLASDAAGMPAGGSLGEVLEALAGRPLVEGDRVPVGRSVFVVVAFEAGRATRFAFEPRPASGRANRRA
jgi:cell volume regulation protein A